MSEVAKAAVLIPFTRIDGDAHFIFIERAHHESDPHSGQVAFPGGRYEDDDGTLRRTALREAEEEVGIKPEIVSIIAKLESTQTGTGFEITPFIGELTASFEPVLDESEVASLFTIPIAWMLIAQYESNIIVKDGRQYELGHFEPYDGKVLWGASARMARAAIAKMQLLNVI